MNASTARRAAGRRPNLPPRRPPTGACSSGGRGLVAVVAALLLVATACDRGSRPAGGGDDPAQAQTRIQAQAQAQAQGARIVSLNGAVTEILFALGAQDRLVGADVSSVWPPDALALPRVGYYRSLSAEGLLSLEPTLLIGESEAGPPQVIAQVQRAGVQTLLFDPAFTATAPADKIRVVGAALGLDDEAAALASRTQDAMNSAIADAEAARARAGVEPTRALFIYARGPGNLLVSGTETAADAVLRLASARNAVEAWSGFRPLNPEALVGAEPDVILIPERGLESIGGIDGVLRLPGVASTPAGRARRVITVDDLQLLGFGPRQPAAIRAVAEQLYGAGEAGARGTGDEVGRP